MKSNRGVTLLMLVFYIIILTLAIGILASISGFFYSNTEYITDNGKNISEYNKFNMYFIEEVKKNSNLYSIKSDEIIFEDGTVYSYNESDSGIYRNQVKICDNINFCSFAKIIDDDTNKIIINVKMSIEASTTFQTDTDYVLKYW